MLGMLILIHNGQLSLYDRLLCQLYHGAKDLEAVKQI